MAIHPESGPRTAWHTQGCAVSVCKGFGLGGLCSPSKPFDFKKKIGLEDGRGGT